MSVFDSTHFHLKVESRRADDDELRPAEEEGGQSSPAFAQVDEHSAGFGIKSGEFGQSQCAAKREESAERPHRKIERLIRDFIGDACGRAKYSGAYGRAYEDGDGAQESEPSLKRGLLDGRLRSLLYVSLHRLREIIFRLRQSQGALSPDELVPCSMHCDDVVRISGIVFDLLTELCDVSVYGASERKTVVAPHGVQQLIARYDLALMLYEILQQLELARR